ncbi:MAG: GNAT family N-acetyltransferase [Actinobacteria bacterium]|nr:GNAT family N-acetyltransferase [Actinomycetota bacterium]
MKVAVRSHGSPELEEGVARVRILSYPYFPEVREVEFYADFYRWLESHLLAGEMHRWILTTEEGEVVGHLAAIPQFYRIKGQRVVAHTPGDFMVLPQYAFHALSLMRRFYRTVENCVAIDMLPNVIAVETRLGAEVAGEMQYAAKLLDVSRLPMPRLPGPVDRLLNRREQPTPAVECSNQAGPESPGVEEQAATLAPRPRAPIPTPVKNLLNGALRAADSALLGASGDGLEIEVLEEFDESFDELFEKIAAVALCVPEKDAAFLRWRYGPGSPQAPVTVLGVRGREGLLGYAVLKVTKNGQDGYPLDLTVLPGRSDVARALLGETVRFFRRAGVSIVRYRYLESPTSPRSRDLQRLGFFSRKGRRNVLLVKFKDQALHKAAKDLSNWTYSIGDGEATFWTR